MPGGGGWYAWVPEDEAQVSLVFVYLPPPFCGQSKSNPAPYSHTRTHTFVPTMPFSEDIKLGGGETMPGLGKKAFPKDCVSK